MSEKSTAIEDTKIPDLDLTMVDSTLTGEFDDEDDLDRESNSTRYSVQSQLGKGGMGTVFRVRDSDLKRDVAFKTLNGTPEAGLKARFIKESRITGQLQHPNIVPLHDIGEDANGNLYLSMQLVEGQTLAELITALRAGDPETHRKYTYQRRLEIFLKILAAVQLAHSSMVLHRDLKPANIMLGQFDEVFVMDWGLATYFGEAAPDTGDFQTQEGSVLGTPKYMSPEQAAGQIQFLGPQTDIYSLSAILYEFLTLEHYLGLPEEQSTIVDVISAVMAKAPVAPEFVLNAHQHRISRWLSVTVMRGLKKDPEARISSVAELAEEIRLFLEGKRAPICPHTAMQRGLHELVIVLDKHPVLIPAVTIGLLTAVSIGLYQFVRMALQLF
jgi:eukaryotic-like serine/threonine-protein kinase